ncbi:tyrosine-type recombinase/integrase [Yersinia ruckeri]|nr:tyrosine-type recombinase/integrase [Yersinia ruckeri]EKN3362508.1 tyrosine-type recombinase/integrase [Yersinia ruckeri]EKN4202187.1 tyrosine-type recombinase/integrase [Yersinia ruckeri]EKN4209347.1 tyrosine-type recombinase/integrase [Yersinia ruckeri]EKN4699863.1 tyrosine-type recombinase/integrase [Yersinia ruckeri]
MAPLPGTGKYRVKNYWILSVSPHRFRHTVATNLMKSPDRNIQAVKRLLGHSSLRSTLEYIDEDIDSLRELLEQELMR